MNKPTPPPVQVLAPALLLQGAALRPLYRAVLDGISAARASGYNIAMLVEIQQAIMAVVGHADVRKELPRIVSLRQHGDEPISVAEAAKLLCRSERQIRRIARAEGLGRRVGHQWVLDRVAVLALKREREEQRNDTTAIAAA